MSDEKHREAGATPPADPLAQIRAAAAKAPLHRRELARTEKTHSLVKRLSEASPIAGTLAEVYLRRLGATLIPARALRFRTGGLLAGGPSMLAAIKEIDGTLVGVQTTRLTNAGEAVELAARRIAGTAGTGAVQLFRIKQALGIAQSVEDAIAATHLSCIPCWAAVKPSCLGNVEIPAHVRELHLFANRGAFSNADGIHQLAARYVARGITVVIEHCDERHQRWVEAIAPAGPAGAE